MVFDYKSNVNMDFFSKFTSFEKMGYSIFCHEELVPSFQEDLESFLNHETKDTNILRDLTNIIFEKNILWNNEKRTVVIKKSNYRSSLQRIRTIFSESKAVKAFTRAKFLLENNLDTPLPLAVIEKNKKGNLSEVYYVTESISPHQRVKKYLRAQLEKPDGQTKISELMNSVASYAQEMHKLGFIHLDLNLSNFLITPVDSETYRLTLIDLNRGKFFPELSPLQKFRDISRLYWKDFRAEFFFLYCNGDEDLIRLKWFYDLYYRWRKKRRKIKKRIK